MPNKHASIKDVRKSKKRAINNMKMKTHLKSLERSFFGFIKEKKMDEAETTAQKLQQALDKAAKEHVIHKNRASKNLSSIHRSLARSS